MLNQCTNRSTNRVINISVELLIGLAVWPTSPRHTSTRCWLETMDIFLSFGKRDRAMTLTNMHIRCQATIGPPAKRSIGGPFKLLTVVNHTDCEEIQLYNWRFWLYLICDKAS